MRNYRVSDRGLVDRTKLVTFKFNGKTYRGFEGDTLASALIANGEHLIARSFKYHRPRGILAAGPEDPAAIVQIGTDKNATEPNTRVTEQEIYDGLEANSQNCWPSVKFDKGVVNDMLAPFFPAGFYYKTFQGPPGNWHFFEEFIRNAAGLGVAPEGPDPDSYEHINRHVDVLVVGAGPAGLMAAQAAASSGAEVTLCDENAHFGGHLLSQPAQDTTIDEKPAHEWVREMEQNLDRADNVTLLNRTCAFGYFGNNFVTLWQKLHDHVPRGERQDGPRHRIWRIRANRVVIATGALERPLVFHQNDRPGIMLAGAVRTFLNKYGVLAGRRPVVFTNNDTAWNTAFELDDAGAKVVAIIDVRDTVSDALQSEAKKRGIPVYLNHAIVGTAGRARVTAASVAKLISGKQVAPDPATMACDIIATSGGWTPNVALFSQSRGKLRYDEDWAAFRPGMSFQAERSAGGCNATHGLAEILKEAAEVGLEAATLAGFPGATANVPNAQPKYADDPKASPLWLVPSDKPEHRARAFVDLQDDVTAKDLALAVKEGYRSVEHAKRYTTQGMGTDQGKTSNMNAFGILAGVLGKDIPEVGVTTFRQPYKPVTFGAVGGQFTGKLMAPRRGTPMHAWHADHGAIFEPVGDWLRAWCYPRNGENPEQAVQREARMCRASVGVLDASTLGKIDIKGPDAREFLNRVYTNAWMKLAPGKCRYGLMLSEDGMVMDDGVTACLADDHFHMTTTTGGAARVLTMMEDYLQTEWPDLQVYLTSVTEQWAVASISGPKSADVVARLCPDLHLSEDAFPFMAHQSVEIAGIPARIFRISFTGELAYEINIPSRYGPWLWEQVIAAGADFAITPYGTEAMHLLRAEKGFIIVGQDTDGTVTPHDLRMDWIVKKSGDFIGRRSLSRSDTARPDRKQLVGFLTHDPARVLDEGAHIIDTPQEPAPPVPMLGHITSSYFSPTLGRSIAMGLMQSGGARIGETVYITCGGGTPIPATVTETDFLAMDLNQAAPAVEAAE